MSATTSTSASTTHHVHRPGGVGSLQTDAPARVWRFSETHLSESPSIRDGMTREEETRLRRAGSAHIMETVRLVLEAPYRNMPEEKRQAAAVIDARARMPSSAAFILFNRFYMRHSFLRHDRFVRRRSRRRRDFSLHTLHSFSPYHSLPNLQLPPLSLSTHTHSSSQLHASSLLSK